MRKTLLVLALAGTAMFAPGMTSAAHASHGYGWYSSGPGFNVGGLTLSFVYGQPFRGYGPDSYYRFNRPIHYRGAHCTSRCYVDHGTYYHARGCPVVRGYFRSYNVDPYRAYVHYAPRYARYSDSGYGYHRRYRHYYREGYRRPGYYGSYYRGDSCARPW
ncbi:MAG: hypothetical protein QOJ16_264 [Acidobacteriota bacterium]|jgi:hypothetical protein|nr:hypothetical protein [Acidobacteriota bacterium]